MLSKERCQEKSSISKRKENAMQLLVSFGFSYCEFPVYYPSTNNQIYSCKIRNWRLTNTQIKELEGPPLALG